MRAAAEVRAANRELTHDKTMMASLEEISTRPGLAQAATAILHALEAGAELAYIVSEQADNPNLAGPARALSIRAHNDIEAGLAPRHDPAEDIVWVSPADILAKRTIPVPAPVAETLRASGVVVVDAAESAAAVASVAGGDGSARTHGCEIGAEGAMLLRRQPFGRSPSEHATSFRHSR